jgi:hypothetical protein
MKNLTIRICGMLLLGIFIWQGCKKGDFENPKLAAHDSEFAFPLFNTNLNISDLVGKLLKGNDTKESLVVNADNTLTLSYSGDVSETKATKILDFLNTVIGFPVDTSYFRYSFDLIPNGVNIRKAELNGGTIGAIIFNTLPQKIHGTFYLPQLTKNGVPYSIPFEIQPGGAGGQTIDMAGYSLLSQGNDLIIQYDAYLEDGTKILKLPGNNGIPAVVMTLQYLTFSYLEGYWDKVEYDLNTDTIDININQIGLNGEVKVKNPKITITVYNSWGFPTRGLIKYLRFKAKNGDLLELKSPVIIEGTDVGIDFNYPSFAAGEVGQTKATTFYFDETNSNIAEIFNSNPTQMIYKVQGLANAESDPSLIGFITDTSTVRMNVQVELLLEGQLLNFPAEQNLNLDFGSFADSTGFESAEFKLVTENGMPMTTSMQIYFRDINDVNIDSLFADGPQDAIRSAPVDAVTGLTTGITRTETFIPFTAARFENLRIKAKKGFFKAAFSTAQDGAVPVKILNNQGAVVKMGVKLKR